MRERGWESACSRRRGRGEEGRGLEQWDGRDGHIERGEGRGRERRIERRRREKKKKKKREEEERERRRRRTRTRKRKEEEDEDDDEEKEEEEGSIAERRTSSGYDDCNGATRVLPSSETSWSWCLR